MSKFIGTVSDYTELAKEYAPMGQRQTLWDQFLTGVQTSYQNLAEQTKSAYAYDISDAYSNYKKQQLQLQMNEQIGSGFQQELGTQLKTQYEGTAEALRAKETESLYELGQQEVSAIQQGAKSFEQLGEQLRAYDKALLEYAEYAEIPEPENTTTIEMDEQGTKITKLTDYGRMYYHDILSNLPSKDKMTFDDWLLDEELSTSTLSYSDRVALWDAYKNNPDLFKSQVTGLTNDFDYEATRTKYEKEQADKARAAEIDTKVRNISTALTKTYGGGGSHVDRLEADLEDIVAYYGYDKSQVELSTWYDSNDLLYRTTVTIDDSVLTESQRNKLKNLIGNEYTQSKSFNKGKWKVGVASRRSDRTYQKLLSILANKE